MEFREHATHEISALVDRLSTGWSATSARELKSLREKLAAAAAAAETALAANIALDDRQLAALSERLSAEADAQAKAMAERVKTEAKATIDAAQKQLQQRTRESEQLAKTVEELRLQAGALRAQLQEQTARAGDLERRLEDSSHELDAARTECGCVMAQLETEAAERAKLAVALSTAQKLQQKARAAQPSPQRSPRDAAPPDLTASEDVMELAAMPIGRLRAKFQRVETDH